jgi:hypothetical protein
LYLATRVHDGLRVSVVREKWQSSDLLLAVLRRPLAPRRKESGCCHSGWPSLGSAQRPSQPVELAREQGEGEPKDVAGILGHSRIQTTLDLYTDEDLDEMIAAQEKFLGAVGFEAGSVQ